MKTIYLVSCVATKDPRAAPMPARDRYTSPWFRAAREYVERQIGYFPNDTGGNWYILSARHGLLHPHKPIEDYNQFLEAMDKAAVEQWKEDVRAQLAAIVQPGDRVVLLAGRSYRKHLEEWLKKQGATVEVPMRSLGIGEQVQWLNKN